MLREVLQLLAQDETLTQEDIAARLKVPKTLVAAMVDELTRLGYLKMSVRCGGACEGCALAASCSGISAQRVWQMTDKGRQSLQNA